MIWRNSGFTKWFLAGEEDGKTVASIGHANEPWIGYQVTLHRYPRLSDIEGVGLEGPGFETVEAAKLAVDMELGR